MWPEYRDKWSEYRDKWPEYRDMPSLHVAGIYTYVVSIRTYVVAMHTHVVAMPKDTTGKVYEVQRAVGDARCYTLPVTGTHLRVGHETWTNA